MSGDLVPFRPRGGEAISGELVPRRPAVVGTGAASLNAELLRAAFLAGYTGRTREAYTADLRQWFGWCAAHVVDPLTVRRAHVDVYARELEAAGYAPSTIARRLCAMSGYYKYAVDEDDVPIERSPLRRVRRPTVSDTSPRQALDRDELRALLAAAAARGPAAEVLVALMAFNGLRVSETCEACDTDVGTALGHRLLAVTRKGGALVDVPLAGPAAAAVDRRLAQLAGDASRPAARDGSRLVGVGRRSALRWIVAMAADAGITKRVSPHSLRHTFVTLCLDAGAPLEAVQAGAAHADPKTTIRYDHSRKALDDHVTYTLAAYVAGDLDVDGVGEVAA
jgi:site-specific recombinase XerD